MNDDPTPLTDEELSAAVDGEADQTVLERIEADPEARARRDELRGAADRVAGLPPASLDEATVDRLVAAAVDAPAAPPVPSRSVPRTTWLVAAAVILLVGLGLGLVLTGRDGGEDVASSDATESFDTVGSSIDDGGAASEAAPEAAGDVGADGLASTTAPATGGTAVGIVDLGTFASGTELREALATSFPVTDTTTRASSPAEVPAPSAVERCATQLQVTLELDGEPLHVGVATVDGDRVLVYEFATTATDDGSPTTLVAAVGVDACDPLELFER